MKNYFVRVLNLLIIIGAIFAYNSTLTQRAQAEEIARLEAELESANLVLNQQQKEETENSEQPGSVFRDGEYEGSGTGFGGEISVSVTVENGEITEIAIISAPNEDKAYLETAGSIIDDILEQQSADVDTVSGATFSSTGIREAVSDALKTAMGD